MSTVFHLIIYAIGCFCIISSIAGWAVKMFKKKPPEVEPMHTMVINLTEEDHQILRQGNKLVFVWSWEKASPDWDKELKKL